MKPERIKQMIDNNIQKMLVNQDFDTIRTNLYVTARKFRSGIDYDKYSIFDLENIKDIRTKYKMYYIYFAQKRIADLVKIQFSNKNQELSQKKKFNLLIFKEKLTFGSNESKYFSEKYLEVLKKHI
jgi:hypothetical protein